jgi:hypothetical protein
MVTKREVTVSLLTISILLTFIASMITVTYAAKPPTPPGPPPPPGKLWVTTDPSSWPDDPVDKYDVWPGETYYLDIREIPPSIAPDNTLIQIKVANEDWSQSRYRIVKGGRITSYLGSTDYFTWTCPSVKPSNTYIVQYRVLTPFVDHYKPDGYVPPGYKPGNVNVVGGLEHKGHLHVIPEYAFGTAMAITSLFSALGIYTKFRK